MVSEKGRGLSPSAEIGQAPCRWPGSQSLQDCRYAGFRPLFGLWRVIFLCMAQRKVTKRKANPTDSLSCVVCHDADSTRRRAFGLRHPWLRPKAASNILVFASTRIWLCSSRSDLAPGPPLARHPGLAAWQLAFVSANLRGNQNRARLRLGWAMAARLAATRRSERWASQFSCVPIFLVSVSHFMGIAAN